MKKIRLCVAFIMSLFVVFLMIGMPKESISESKNQYTLPYDKEFNSNVELFCVNKDGESEGNVRVTIKDEKAESKEINFKMLALSTKDIVDEFKDEKLTKGKVVIESENIENIDCEVKSKNLNEKGEVLYQYQIGRDDIQNKESYIINSAGINAEIYLTNLEDKAQDFVITRYNGTQKKEEKYSVSNTKTISSLQGWIYEIATSGKHVAFQVSNNVSNEKSITNALEKVSSSNVFSANRILTIGNILNKKQVVVCNIYDEGKKVKEKKVSVAANKLSTISFVNDIKGLTSPTIKVLSTDGVVGFYQEYKVQKSQGSKIEEKTESLTGNVFSEDTEEKFYVVQGVEGNLILTNESDKEAKLKIEQENLILNPYEEKTFPSPKDNELILVESNVDISVKVEGNDGEKNCGIKINYEDKKADNETAGEGDDGEGKGTGSNAVFAKSMISSNGVIECNNQEGKLWTCLSNLSCGDKVGECVPCTGYGMEVVGGKCQCMGVTHKCGSAPNQWCCMTAYKCGSKNGSCKKCNQGFIGQDKKCVCNGRICGELGNEWCCDKIATCNQYTFGSCICPKGMIEEDNRCVCETGKRLCSDVENHRWCCDVGVGCGTFKNPCPCGQGMNFSVTSNSCECRSGYILCGNKDNPDRNWCCQNEFACGEQEGECRVCGHNMKAENGSCVCAENGSHSCNNGEWCCPADQACKESNEGGYCKQCPEGTVADGNKCVCEKGTHECSYKDKITKKTTHWCCENGRQCSTKTAGACLKKKECPTNMTPSEDGTECQCQDVNSHICYGKTKKSNPWCCTNDKGCADSADDGDRGCLYCDENYKIDEETGKCKCQKKCGSGKKAVCCKEDQECFSTKQNGTNIYACQDCSKIDEVFNPETQKCEVACEYDYKRTTLNKCCGEDEYVTGPDKKYCCKYGTQYAYLDSYGKPMCLPPRQYNLMTATYCLAGQYYVGTLNTSSRKKCCPIGQRIVNGKCTEFDKIPEQDKKKYGIECPNSDEDAYKKSTGKCCPKSTVAGSGYDQWNPLTNDCCKDGEMFFSSQFYLEEGKCCPIGMLYASNIANCCDVNNISAMGECCTAKQTLKNGQCVDKK